MKRGKHEAPRKGGGKILVALFVIVLMVGAGVGAWKFAPLLVEKIQAAIAKEDTVDTPPEEPTPEPVPEPKTAADIVLEGMTLEEKIYQLFVVTPSSITGANTVTMAGDMTRTALEQYPVGGFFYDATNLQTKEQVQTMLTNTQGFVKIPLLLTIDEEGGRVARLMDTIGTTRIGPMLDFKDQGEAKATENAATIAADLLSCGFNMDLAPVADVLSNSANTVIGNRAYSDDFQQAATLIAAAVKGFHDGGVACTLKHFPGHGDSTADSHNESVIISKSLDELRAGELLPFQAGIDAGADAVMLGHLIVSQVDEVPAPLSYTLVTELLRQEMGFDGVVMTDSLQMKAISDYDSADVAVQAIRAGVDLLLCPVDLKASVDALTQAVASGTLTEERINESVKRILTLKENRGLLSGVSTEETSTAVETPTADEGADTVGTADTTDATGTPN